MSSHTHNARWWTAGPAAAAPGRYPPEGLPGHPCSQGKRKAALLKDTIDFPTTTPLVLLHLATV